MMREKTNRHAPQRLTRRTLVACFIVLAAVPAVILVGWRLENQDCYLTSLAVIACALAHFLLSLDGRRPRARELVVILALSALAAVARAAFIWLPHFKPITAIVIIAGIAFGAEAGFLTGTVSGFVSNFVFGQGPWTPWQMFAFGVAGFLAGFFFRKGWLKTTRPALSIFGAAIVLLVVGPLLDTCALATMPAAVAGQSAWQVYLSGLPVNAVHAAATVITLLVAANPLLDKLTRIQEKYGLMEA